MNEYSVADVVSMQRTEKGLSYEKALKRLRQARAKGDAETLDMVREIGAELLAMRGVAPSAVHANTFLQNMSVQYANDAYIGDQIMPAVPVGKRSDDFAVYPKRERLAYPDDALGSRSEANELSETRSSDNYSVRDYGFQNFVSASTIENEDDAFDEMLDLIEAINEGIAFKREKRIAAIATTAANFSGNTTTLSGTSQWSDAASDPIEDIQTARAAIWNGRGQTRVVGACSLEVFNTLARHAKVLDLLKYNRSGLAKREELAQIFGLDDILVGAAREDTANEGQTASYSRIWGKTFGVYRVAMRPSRRSAHFGSTFRLKNDPATTEWFDPKVGKSGGYCAKVGVSEDHKVIAGDTAYLIAAAIA